MEKNKKLLPIKFLALLIVTNTLSYLIALPNSESDRNSQALQEIERPGYIKVLIRGELFTEFAEDKVVSLYNKYNQKIIDHVVLIKDLSSKEGHSFESSTNTEEQYLISVHENHLNKLITKNQIRILPYTKLNLMSTRRARHEISF